jgi:hypothetical protein
MRDPIPKCSAAPASTRRCESACDHGFLKPSTPFSSSRSKCWMSFLPGLRDPCRSTPTTIKAEQLVWHGVSPGAHEDRTKWFSEGKRTPPAAAAALRPLAACGTVPWSRDDCGCQRPPGWRRATARTRPGGITPTRHDCASPLPPSATMYAAAATQPQHSLAPQVLLFIIPGY